MIPIPSQGVRVASLRDALSHLAGVLSKPVPPPPLPCCSKMLVSCEVTMELYMGLAASPQIQVGPGGRIDGAHAPTRMHLRTMPPVPVFQLSAFPSCRLSPPNPNQRPRRWPYHRIGCALLPLLPRCPALSPQWVYFEEETPVAILEEVQAQLLGAYEFIQDREAEAPAQYRAVQVRPCCAAHAVPRWPGRPGLGPRGIRTAAGERWGVDCCAQCGRRARLESSAS